MTVIQTERYRGHNIELHVMEDSESCNPREWDNGTLLVLSHRRYNLPNEAEVDFDAFDGWDEVEAHLRETLDIVGIKPVFMYDHSGVTYSTSPFSCPWDSGQVGFIVMTKEGQAEMGTPDDLVGELLDGDVEVFGAWAAGDVYGFVVQDDDGEEVDACWGFVGADDYAMVEARAAVDAKVDAENAERLFALEPVD